MGAAGALLTDAAFGGPCSQTPLSGGLRLPFEIALGGNLRESLSACLHLETDLNNISDLSQAFPGDLDRIREQAVDGAGAPWGWRGTCRDLLAFLSTQATCRPGHPSTRSRSRFLERATVQGMCACGVSPRVAIVLA